jgi:hypothetical protein
MMVPLHDIELVECRDQNLMRAYCLMLIEGKRPLAIFVARQNNDRHPFVVIDGRHRICAARSIKRKVIKAEIVPMPEAEKSDST